MVSIAGLLAIPVLVVVASLAVPTGEIWRHLVATVLPGYVRNSVLLTLGVGVGVAVTGTASAWLVTMTRFRGRALLEWALLLPLAMPAYLLAYVYTDVLDVYGPVQTWIRATFALAPGQYPFPDVRSLGGAIVVMTLAFYPYVYLLARTAFMEQSVSVLEASRSLGKGPWATFFRIALPLARPALVGGIALASMEALGDFGAVQHFGVSTFTTGIYRTWFGFGSRTAAAQLAAVLMIFILLLIVVERWSRGRRRYDAPSGRGKHLPSHRLSGVRGVLALVFGLVPIVFGFVLPTALLVGMAFDDPGRSFDPRFWRLAGNSLTVAGLTALLGVVLALLVAYGVRLRPSPASRAASRVAALGYAVPGSVIAVGVLMPAGVFDNALDGWLRATFGVSSGLLLSGTIVALVFAYLVRFLAVSLSSIEASLAKITPSMDEAARSLGRGSWRTLVRVHVPMLRGSLFTAGLMVFVEVMKELPATMIVRPFDFDTLAVEVYRLASDERLAQAAGPALAVAVVGMVPVILLSFAIAGTRGRD
ncbi:MAG: iron ABC transporter permease [Trueperaceae bacterium]